MVRKADRVGQTTDFRHEPAGKKTKAGTIQGHSYTTIGKKAGASSSAKAENAAFSVFRKMPRSPSNPY